MDFLWLFFFKQKTAYDMRISDWSSDVCSSDLQDQLGSMTFTHSALWPYLYGHRVEWEMVDGELIVNAIKNPSHVFGSKNIPSGFFDQHGTENVSAVLFRSDEHTSELQSLMRISYAVFCLKKKKKTVYR